MTIEADTMWSDLPPAIAERLRNAGITPGNIGDQFREDIQAIPGLGPGAVRTIIRAGYPLEDTDDVEPGDQVEALDLPLDIYEKLIEKGYFTVFDFVGKSDTKNRGADGCSLMQGEDAFTVNQVAAIRQALEEVGRGFADLSAERTLADIPFDTGVLELLDDQRIELSTSLQEFDPTVLMQRLGEQLAEQYWERIKWAFWVAGYDLL